MFKLFLVLACAASQAVNALPSAKIIGGANAKNGQLPSLVSLQEAESRIHICGGALISQRYILTAAHCFKEGTKPADVVAYVGSVDKTQGGTTYTLSHIVPDEFFGVGNNLNDIALLRTSKVVELTPNVQPLGLPDEDDDIRSGANVTLAGWGTTSYPVIKNPDILKFYTTTTITNVMCQQLIGTGDYIYEGHICVDGIPGESPCIGDAGSPLIYGNITVGIFSMGFPCAYGQPEIATRLTKYVGWIKNTQADLDANYE